jgi:hypothetical protein
MWTTGACTVENYTDSKQGKKGEFHHTLGFVVVEIVDDHIFHCRQVTADDNGDFCDLYYGVKSGKVAEITSISTLVMGDIHLGQDNPQVMERTKRLLNLMRPDHTVIHDIFDGQAINHHEEKDPILQYHRHKDGTNILKDEVDRMLTWIEGWKSFNLVVVRSNHDDFVDRWIKSSDWKKNTINSIEYMQYAIALLTKEADNGIIPYIINKHYPDVTCLGINDSFRVHEWELASHGHIGCNGSRGSVEQFRRLNTKMVTAHSHTPERKDGALSVGTSTNLKMGYNVGASSWLHSHVIIHNNGKAQHINFIEGEFTTLKHSKERGETTSKKKTVKSK